MSKLLVSAVDLELKDEIFRNPGMGFVLYIDAFSEDGFPADAAEFWKRAETAAKYASIFYIRAPWSVFEPEEGKYAWIYDDNYKEIINLALQKGLKLAFRVYVDGKDSFQQATPEFVKEYGCEGYTVSPWSKTFNTFWTPYLNDKIFQKKFTSFIEAFAREYDDAGTVDYIDAGGLGYWGEMSNVQYLSTEDMRQVFEWITGAYQKNFKNVLLGNNYGNSFHIDQQKELLDRGWLLRCDGFGSPVWFTDDIKNKLLIPNWKKSAVFAENCYHHLVSRDSWWRGDGFGTLRDCLSRVVNDAEDCHANTLDLRVLEDAEAWLEKCPDLVEYFLKNAGYKFWLSEITVSAQDTVISITLNIENSGWGKLPSDNCQWKNKYKLAFAVVSDQNEILQISLCDNLNPAAIYKGNKYPLNHLFNCVLPKGRYSLCFCIVDASKENKPSIRLPYKHYKDLCLYKIASIEVES